jgi:hypothetical protein
MSYEPQRITQGQPLIRLEKEQNNSFGTKEQLWQLVRTLQIIDHLIVGRTAASPGHSLKLFLTISVYEV